MLHLLFTVRSLIQIDFLQLPSGYARSEESVKAESLVVGLKAVKTSAYIACKLHRRWTRKKKQDMATGSCGKKKTLILFFIVKPNSVRCFLNNCSQLLILSHTSLSGPLGRTVTLFETSCMHVPNAVPAECKNDSFFLLILFAFKQEPQNSRLLASLNPRLKHFLFVFLRFSSLCLSPFGSFPRSLFVSRRWTYEAAWA